MKYNCDIIDYRTIAYKCLTKRGLAERITEPGVYTNVPFDVYLLIDAVNHSRIKEMRHGTPAHAKYQIDNPRSATTSMELGTIVHEAILEPDRFRHEVAFTPNFGRLLKHEASGTTSEQGKKNKEKKLKFYERNQGKTLVSYEHGQVLRGIFASIKDHARTRQILDYKGYSEVVIIFEHTKVSAPYAPLCKVRVDKWIPGIAAIDLKTTQSASYEQFSKSAHKYGYFTAAAMYLDALAFIGEKKIPYKILAIETNPPYLPHVFNLEWLDEARGEYKEWLSKYVYACDEDNWHGYEEETDLSPPEWAMARYTDGY